MFSQRLSIVPQAFVVRCMLYIPHIWFLPILVYQTTICGEGQYWATASLQRPNEEYINLRRRYQHEWRYSKFDSGGTTPITKFRIRGCISVLRCLRLPMYLNDRLTDLINCPSPKSPVLSLSQPLQRPSLLTPQSYKSSARVVDVGEVEKQRWNGCPTGDGRGRR